MDKKKVVEKMEGCNINFSKVENRSIKVFNDKGPVKGIEIKIKTKIIKTKAFKEKL